jgi:hypothetical protein
MRGSLLAMSNFGCLASVILASALCGRSTSKTDWLRINMLGRAAVIASSNQHFGAAFVSDSRQWLPTDRQQQAIVYHYRGPINLLTGFSSQSMGFAYNRVYDARLIVFPLWSVAAAACVPPLVWLGTRRRRKSQSA